MVLGDLKLDKNKPPYLPSKVDWVRERVKDVFQYNLRIDVAFSP